MLVSFSKLSKSRSKNDVLLYKLVSFSKLLIIVHITVQVFFVSVQVKATAEYFPKV